MQEAEPEVVRLSRRHGDVVALLDASSRLVSEARGDRGATPSLPRSAVPSLGDGPHPRALLRAWQPWHTVTEEQPSGAPVSAGSRTALAHKVATCPHSDAMCLEHGQGMQASSPVPGGLCVGRRVAIMGAPGCRTAWELKDDSAARAPGAPILGTLSTPAGCPWRRGPSRRYTA
jgi:hypothetical protein